MTLDLQLIDLQQPVLTLVRIVLRHSKQKMMKNDIKFVKEELLRQYKPKFIFFFVIIILILLSPLLFVYEKVAFDPKEFANIYTATVFGSILIAIVLQVIEVYKTGLSMYSRTYGIVKSMDELVENMLTIINSAENNLELHGSLLLHYRESLLLSLTASNKVNELLFTLSNRSEIAYLCESLKHPVKSEAKKHELIAQLSSLSQQIKLTIEKL